MSSIINMYDLKKKIPESHRKAWIIGDFGGIIGGGIGGFIGARTGHYIWGRMERVDTKVG